MYSKALRTAIEEAVSALVDRIELPGIVDAHVRNVAVGSSRLQQLATQLEQDGHAEVELGAEIEFFLRVSNTDLLKSIQCVLFRIKVRVDEHGLEAAASAESSWATAWEKGIERLKRPALHLMKEDVWKIAPDLSEDSSTFQAAMILLASELVGPRSDRITTFLGYPPALVRWWRHACMRHEFGRRMKSGRKNGSTRKTGAWL
jgi:hypothetical protein